MEGPQKSRANQRRGVRALAGVWCEQIANDSLPFRAAHSVGAQGRAVNCSGANAMNGLCKYPACPAGVVQATRAAARPMWSVYGVSEE